MHIARVSIRNYRCFSNAEILLRPGVNVFIGENNSGKTTILRALMLPFSSSRRSHSIHDFYQGITDFSNPPQITVTLTLQGSEKTSSTSDYGLVSLWLTTLAEPWEAQIRYAYFLPEEYHLDFVNHLGQEPTKSHFWTVVERFLPRYLARTFGGVPDQRADPDSLAKFSCQFIDAIRDVESHMYSGKTPLLRAMLRKVLDLKETDSRARDEKAQIFKGEASALVHGVISRLDLDRLFSLVEHTGAQDGGRPSISGTFTEADLLAALHLIVKRLDLELPATNNGLGYNNLLYISLILASLEFETSADLGPNATQFPMLFLEEPEAHLHPALQYKLLRYIAERIRTGQKSRQAFITTHSTHITAAAGLDALITLVDDGGVVRAAYPGKTFPDSDYGRQSKKYVERYLDATKSTMLFAKAVFFVEGLTELHLIPRLAEYLGASLEDNRVAIVAVGGVNFKHFLPIFGATSPDTQCFSLPHRVACLIDADPLKRDTAREKSRWTKCYPCELETDSQFEYLKQSHVASKLEELCQHGTKNILVKWGQKTFEYDLALVNSTTKLLVTENCTDPELLDALIEESPFDDSSTSLAELKQKVPSLKADQPSCYATAYLISVEDSKGAHAFDLAIKLKANFELSSQQRVALNVPGHIKKLVAWVCET